jgi:hypothetical protein
LTRGCQQIEQLAESVRAALQTSEDLRIVLRASAPGPVAYSSTLQRGAFSHSPAIPWPVDYYANAVRAEPGICFRMVSRQGWRKGFTHGLPGARAMDGTDDGQ